MKRLATILLFPLLFTPAFAAVTIVECEDSDGERTFQAACPPGTTQVGSRKLPTGTGSQTGPASTGSSRTINATLYMVPECDPCQDIHDYLSARNISITMKDASGDIEVQDEIRELTGDLQVPVVVIDGKTLTGYSRSELRAALAAAGYAETANGQ